MYRPHASRKTLSHYKCYRPSIETNNTVLNSPWHGGYSAIIVWCDGSLVRMQYGLIFIVFRPESRLAFFWLFSLKNWHFHFFAAHEGIERPVGRLVNYEMNGCGWTTDPFVSDEVVWWSLCVELYVCKFWDKMVAWFFHRKDDVDWPRDLDRCGIGAYSVKQKVRLWMNENTDAAHTWHKDYR